jgi:hypothetical protein
MNPSPSSPEFRPSSSIRFLSELRAAAAVLLLLAALFAPARVPARPAGAEERQSLSGSEFAATVSRIGIRIQSLEKDPRAAQTLADSLPFEWIVGARGVRVNAGGLRALAEEYLREPAQQNALRAGLEAQLRELQDLAAALSTAPEGVSSLDAHAAHARLSEILSRRDFQSAMRGSDLELWKLRLMHWLAKKLEALFRAIPVPGSAGRYVLWALIAILTTVVAVWLFRYFLRHEAAAGAASPAPPSGRGWNDWLRAGLEAAQAGRYREAIHALYWTVVYRLEELHFWSLDRARTPREYLHLLATRAVAPPSSGLPPQLTPEQRDALETLTRGFELTWYGYRQAGQEDFQRALAHLEVFGCLPS